MAPAQDLDRDTIAAVSTPPGRGGIGIVRLSGPQARSIAEPLLRLRHPLAPSKARFAHILDLTAPMISPPPLDEAVVTFFAAPHSYTTEDIVEIATHGAPVLLDHIMRHCLAHGARLANPGEFTRRAFLARRIDLTQAEAVHDLISADTLHQARLAARQLGGALSRIIAPIKQRLIQLIAALEAGIDFAEDDIDVLPHESVTAELSSLHQELKALESTFTYGRIVRDGFTLAIVGRPNTGKSSLFNRLIDRDRAIVTPVPGTTRDPIYERVSLNGIPLELIDTAGLRQTLPTPEGAIEQLGIAKSHEAMAEADLILLVIDATTLPTSSPWLFSRIPRGALERDPLGSAIAMHPDDAATLAILANRPCLIAINKIDLIESHQYAVGTPQPLLVPPFGSMSFVSALTGEGLSELRAAILAALQSASSASDSVLLTNIRQHEAVTQALAALWKAQAGTAAHTPHEMLLLDLYDSLHALDAFTGATTTDDILHLIFSTFCIGK